MSVPSPTDLNGFLKTMEAAGAAGLMLPPPVFTDMETDVRDYRPGDAETGVGAVLVARFPVLERYQNPMGVMQGGVIAAAVDNVVGPLSYMVAPPSATSQMAMTYLRPVAEGMAYVEVEARLASRAGRQLVFDAVVRSPEGAELAVARFTQTVLRR
jgi:uncharacterized protein (TIGR00369 family)